MIERPILFNAEMVRAILDGRKTQTRRVIKPNPDTFCGWTGVEGRGYWPADIEGDPAKCPYGQTDDRLWVREAWAPGYQDGGWGTIFRADGYFSLGARKHERGPYFHAKEVGSWIRWRPSIHMPRWASRITLEITSVRVQRLQEISEEDAMAEGVEKLGEFPCITPWKNYLLKPGQPSAMNHSIARASFMSLWDSINGVDAHKVNPWVWAVSFKMVKP